MEDNNKRIKYDGWDVLYILVQNLFSVPGLIGIILIIGICRIPRENVGVFVNDSLGYLSTNIFIVILISIIIILLIFIIALWKIKNAEIKRIASERDWYQKNSGIPIRSSGG